MDRFEPSGDLIRVINGERLIRTTRKSRRSEHEAPNQSILADTDIAKLSPPVRTSYESIKLRPIDRAPAPTVEHENARFVEFDARTGGFQKEVRSGPQADRDRRSRKP